MRSIGTMTMLWAIQVFPLWAGESPVPKIENLKPVPAPNAAEIARLVDYLSAETMDERNLAEQRLCLTGEPAIEALNVAAHDPDLEKRQRSIRILRRINLQIFLKHLETVVKKPANLDYEVVTMYTRPGDPDVEFSERVQALADFKKYRADSLDSGFGPKNGYHIVHDGETNYFDRYDDKGHTVFKAKVETQPYPEPNPYFRTAEIAKEFKLMEATEVQVDGETLYELVGEGLSEKDSKVIFLVSKVDGSLRKREVIQAPGESEQLIVRKVKQVESFAADTFKFIVPEGYKLQDEDNLRK